MYVHVYVMFIYLYLYTYMCTYPFKYIYIYTRVCIYTRYIYIYIFCDVPAINLDLYPEPGIICHVPWYTYTLVFIQFEIFASCCYTLMHTLGLRCIRTLKYLELYYCYDIHHDIQRHVDISLGRLALIVRCPRTANTSRKSQVGCIRWL